VFIFDYALSRFYQASLNLEFARSVKASLLYCYISS